MLESTEVSTSDIAIVGLSGRFPGAADVAELWAALRAGASGITRFTDAELRAEGVAEELLADPSYVKAGAVLDGIDLFDADLFGMSPKEVQILDPQQRLFLEHCWVALEDAGCDPSRFDGSVGVFGGAAWSTYLTNNLAPRPELTATLGELAVGLANEKDSLTTRVAHILGLSGPTYTIQSYCSTSLVAVAAAATSLVNGECDLALAGGVSVAVPHRVGYRYQQGGMTSPDGRCRAFDAAAQGTPVGSGVAVVALRRLDGALAAGDRIYAVIRGWAVNNDAGRKVGFTAPGVRGQADVVSEALATAGLSVGDIDYVETHGTGTALGDAAELASLQQVFAGERVLLGSVKTNVGHLDRAAGATGLIKTALALHHGELPPTLNFTEPNPQLRTGDADLRVLTERRAWTPSDRPRRAGVSAFGIGGTNAHVVLEEAPPSGPRPRPGRRHEVLVWSARSAAAANEAGERLGDHLDAAGEPGDTAYTLQVGRRVLEHRRAAVLGEGPLDPERVLHRTESRVDRGVGWLICGVGEQYPGMAADLYRTEPRFREVLDDCRATLRELLGTDPVEPFVAPRESGPSLGALLGRDNGNSAVVETDTVQPAVFAVEYALCELLRSWGIEPEVLAGYSVGEYVAATVAAVLSPRDALALVAHRARLISALPGGSMAAVPWPAGEAQARIDALGLRRLDVGAMNGPRLTVLSGRSDDLRALAESLAADGVPLRPLATSHAFHSRMLAPAQAELTAWITEHVTLRPPAIPYAANVTGELITDAEATDPAYWARHMCAPVLFDAALATLLWDKDLALLEIGAGQSLGAMARGHADCTPDRWPLVIPTLPAAADERPGDLVLAEAVAKLWLAGVPISWESYQNGRGLRKTGVPGYPFQRARYWIDPPDRPATPTKPAPEPDSPRVLVPVWRLAPDLARPEKAPRCLVFVGETTRIEPAEWGDEATIIRSVNGFTAANLPDGPLAVVDLRTLDAGEHSMHSLAVLAAALGESGRDDVTLLAVTRGAHAVHAGDAVDPWQAGVAPICLVARQEYPGFRCGSIDLEPGTEPDPAALLSELDAPASVAHRAGRRYLPDHELAETPAGAVIRPGGAYLITGGLGPVGLLVARHLADAGAARIVLTGRRGLSIEDHERAEAVRRLEERGVEVLVRAADVSDPDAMRRIIAEGWFDGVIHAAGETDLDTLRPLRDLTADLLARHLRPKVLGAEALDRAIGELPETERPDFCLLFSSISMTLGGLGFASYAAANAVLSAFTHRARSTRWVAAAWDTWAPTAAQLRGGLGASMAANSMTEEQALAAFDRVLAGTHPSVLVAVNDLDARLAVWLNTEAPAPARATELFPRPELAQPYAPPRSAAERGLAELWSDVLGIAGIGANDNFFDLGGTSMLGLQMLSVVKTRFGTALPAVTLFEAPTVRTLAELLGPTTEPAPVMVERPAARDESDVDHRIAIVGMAGRFPGAHDVPTLWRNLLDAKESISFFTDEQLAASGVPDEVRTDPAYVPARPVLDDVKGFDAGFFGYSPRTATFTDPQQRIFLEVCWEALESAGYAAPGQRGRVGVFGGTNISTYLLQAHDRMRADADFSDYELVMGNDKDALATTVSYTLDLSGPSLSVQTFCSTSLVAVHLACQSLRAGECELAMAGGVSVRVPDRIGHLYQPGGMASVDGHVRAFDADATGSMFGDGAAVVVLKPLADALRDGDTVWAVIRGSAMNNDGALKVGYTAPSVVGQARVIADALADAAADPADVGYVEAHGTGTELGDPIEVAALARAFGPDAVAREGARYCALGSVKTNLGHLDRAAGVTGLIKAALSLRHGVIPPTLHFRRANPEIDLETGPFWVPTARTPWPARPDRPRLAGVNSLGMGGTNVHVVLEEPPVSTRAEEPARRWHLAPLSARSDAAADRAQARLAEALSAEAPALADVAHTLQVGRRRFAHRRVAIGTDLAGLARSLTGDGRPLLGRTDPADRRPVAFLFAGVGEQYPGLVAELYRREPVFREVLDECAAALPGLDVIDLLTGARTGPPSSLAALLGRDDGPAEDPRSATLRRTDVSQPAVFAAEYALARLLMAWGIRPTIMLGYSLGEYVAACLSGVLTLPDALRLVAHRASLIAASPGGAMLAVALSTEDIERRFGSVTEAGLDVAARTGPGSVVLAGPTSSVHAFAARLAAADVACRPMETTHAFHSRMLDPLRAELTEWVAAHISLHDPEIPYLSNVTGEPVDASMVRDPAYWARHMCQTVRFDRAARALLDDPELVVVEIGPGPSLGALLRAVCPRDRWPLIVQTLPAAADQRADDEVLTDALARLWLAGTKIDWSAYWNRCATPGRVPLPTYPFEHQEYWIEGTPTVATAAPVLACGQPSLFDRLGALPRLPEEDWLHLPVWQQKPVPPRASAEPGPWLVFTDGGAASVALPDGTDVIPVTPGDAFGPAGDGFRLRPGSYEDIVALLTALRRDGRLPSRVLHLWTLSGEHRLERGLHTLVALARAAGEVGLDTWSLDVVSAGTQEVLAGEPVDPEAATVTGACRVIPLEYPKVAARLIDVEPSRVADAVAEVLGTGTEAVVALRGGRRWVPGHERLAAPSTEGVLRECGVYLVTGGLGGIGLAMAEHLARDYRARLVLLARTGLPDPSAWDDVVADEALKHRIAGVRTILEHGGEVEIVIGDVSREADVRRAVDVALTRFGALHGVLHAAGVPGIGLMQFKRPEELAAVLDPKVSGTANLARVLRWGEPDELALDFLALFSSITSATGGGPGQVDYCAANAFLDAFAQHAAGSGRRVVSVGWGEWAWNAWERGLDGYDNALQEFFRANRARFGIRFDEGWRSLLRVLAAGESRVVVSTQDFTAITELAPGFTVDLVRGSIGGSAEAGVRHPRPDLATAYLTPSTSTQRAIAEVWGEALKLDRIGTADSFFELGGNSLIGVDIVARLSRVLHVDALAPHVLYEAPTVAALAELIDGRQGGQPSDDRRLRAELRRSGRVETARRRRSHT